MPRQEAEAEAEAEGGSNFSGVVVNVKYHHTCIFYSLVVGTSSRIRKCRYTNHHRSSLL